ncbi:MAG: two-component regulator propeller domain-containing protein, partial [Bacteroidota bacterium]|nr:two-component regulator propeller domain-containing protein [Bacteroidota bacterium]
MFGHVVYAQVNVLEIEQINYHNGLPYNSVQSIKQDKYGFIWFSSFVGISRFDGYHFTEYLPEPENQKTIFTKSVYNMMLDSALNLWIAFFDTSKYCLY